MAAETQPAASASEPEAANVLAKALIAMRQATRAAGDSGSAEAWVTIDHLWKTSRYVKPSHRIVFRFKGNDSRSEGYRPAPASQPAATVLSSQEPQLEYVRLITHEREITYASLSPTDKGECAVYRFPADNHNEFIGAMDWSYFSLTSVPDYVDHEFDIIEAAAQRGTRKRQGHTVLLEYNATFPPDCPTTVQKVVMVFDMTLGGMMSRYEETMVDVDLDTNEEHRSVAVMETDWQRQGAQVVPVKRTIEVIGRVNGKQTSHAQNTVEFRHWKFEAIDPAEFTF